MTVKELGEYLLSCDEDILNFKIGVTFVIQLNPKARLSARCDSITIQENADIDAKMLWLKARVKDDD